MFYGVPVCPMSMLMNRWGHHTVVPETRGQEAQHLISMAKFKDVIGPDGQPGYHHVVALAYAELFHHAFVTQRQSREIIPLWEKLTDRDEAADKLGKGVFKTSNSHAHTPGGDSVKRACSSQSLTLSLSRVVLGQGAGAAQSHQISRLVEAIMLELCRRNHQGKAIAGVRINR
ncbi:hypothetical protein FQN60_018801 [Etheostoma spectabile]|uniref:Uncharacterized protein n=1 Tax=Etheostoma spectabile TaxID=54343 RepID=A0A5J5C826_9PERO|nr:hypothetical protein FQN60_018801 [Etheostoma spectabile]